MNAQRLGLKCMLCWCLSSKVGFWGLQVLLLVMSVTYGNAWAARSRDASKPIEIAADSVEIDEGRNTSTYTGKVEVQQGSMRLLADHVVVQHQPSRQPGRIAATGSPVHYQQSEADGQQVKAEAKRMEYNILRQEILLSGAARLNRSQDSFHSDRIIYYRNKGIIKAGSSAAGKQRVRISIAPQEVRGTHPPPNADNSKTNTDIPSADDTSALNMQAPTHGRAASQSMEMRGILPHPSTH